jgi:NTE family protein
MSEKPKIGLALSGGVGYCMAHIGVLRVLEDAGIKPDMIAGTSGGALIGAMYASGIRSDRIEQIAKGISWRKLMGLHLLFKGMMSSKPIEEMVDELIGKGRRFADLGIPLLVTAVDLVREEKVLYPEHDDQTISRPVRASCSLPLVFAPVKDGERMLVDGGMLTPLPVLELRARGMDRVIAVSFRSSRSAPKNVFEVALRTMSVANNERKEAARQAADVLIECHLGQTSRWDLQAAIDLIKVGRMAAEERLAALKAMTEEVGS